MSETYARGKPDPLPDLRTADGRFGKGNRAREGAPDPYHCRGLPTKERRWKSRFSRELSQGGYGSRRDCLIRAWQGVMARRIWEWSNSLTPLETVTHAAEIRAAAANLHELEDYARRAKRFRSKRDKEGRQPSDQGEAGPIRRVVPRARPGHTPPDPGSNSPPSVG